jgi:hypothetical protein
MYALSSNPSTTKEKEKKSMRPYLKNKLIAKGLGVWLQK